MAEEPRNTSRPGDFPPKRVDVFPISTIVKHVLNYLESLDRMFHALGDRTRRGIVERLSRSPASVSDIARPFDMSLPAVVQHLAVLEAAGIVSSEKVGRVRTYHLVPDGLVPVSSWIVGERTPQMKNMSSTERSQSHATFVIEGGYDAPVEKVWHALADNDA